jgi:hypothetical protein
LHMRRLGNAIQESLDGVAEALAETVRRLTLRRCGA